MLDISQPGCYSHAATNDPRADYCQKCIWFKSCTEKARSRLLKIHEEMNVSDLLSRYELDSKPICLDVKKRKTAGREKVKRYELNEDQLSLVSTLPKKTAKVITQLFKKGIDLRVELISGVNPFESARPAFMKTPTRLLLEGGFSRPMLTSALINEFPNWTETTRKSHEGIIMNVLNALDLVEYDNGYYRIAK